MKRFLDYVTFALVVLVCIFACGALTGQYCDGAELTISEPVSGRMSAPTIPGLPGVYDMTDAEFFAWATHQNAKAKAEWDEWYKTAPPRWISCTVTTVKEHSKGPHYPADWYGTGIQGQQQGFNNFRSIQREYQQFYLNPDYVSRPLTIINPYCRPARPQRFSHTTGVWLSWPAR